MKPILTTVPVLLVLLAPAALAAPVVVNPTGNASGGIAVSGTGDATSTCVDLGYVCAPGVAVSGTGSAESGGAAVSGTGPADSGFVSVSGLNAAHSYGVSVAGGAGDASGSIASISVLGNSTCAGPNCVAVSATNNAPGGNVNVGGCAAFTATGHSDYCGFGFGAGAYNDFWCVLGSAPFAQACLL